MASKIEEEVLKFAALTKKLAEPVDMEDLVKRGVIKKAGAWWRVLKFKELPESLRLRAYAFSSDKKGQKMKFGALSRYEKVAKKAQKLASRIK